jgi:hypothetical protein
MVARTAGGVKDYDDLRRVGIGPGGPGIELSFDNTRADLRSERRAPHALVKRRALEAHLRGRGRPQAGRGRQSHGLAGTPRSELLEEERIGLAVLRLLAAYALRLCASDPDRHSVLAMDEAWALLADSQGRALLERISRLGRSQNLTPILATQMLGDAQELEPLVGAFFAFGVETGDEARRALSFLRLDPDDEAARRRIIGHRAGRCHLRDFAGQVAPIQIEPPGWLLERLDTTPGA